MLAPQRGKRRVDFALSLLRQSLIDDEGGRQREWIAGEAGELLLGTVFVNGEILGQQPFDHLTFGVFDRHRNSDEVDGLGEGIIDRGCSPRSQKMLPGGTVLISREPGGGGCGLVLPGAGGCPGLRVFDGCSGFSPEEESPWSLALPGGGTFMLAAGALFWGAGASGSF